MRLIDADKLYPDCMTKDGKLAISQSQLANAPTVDIKDIYQEGHYDGHLEGYTKAINEEKPQGEWINPADCLCYQCSNCGEYTNNEGTVAEGLFDYCPKCGAKMQKGSA